MKYEIFYSNRAEPKLPISLKRVEIFKNELNLWCYSFYSENHKRLYPGASSFTKWFYNPETEQYTDSEFNVHSCTYWDEEDPNFAHLYIIPESKSEELEISSCTETSLSEGWTTNVIFVPIHLFYPPKP